MLYEVITLGLAAYSQGLVGWGTGFLDLDGDGFLALTVAKVRVGVASAMTLARSLICPPPQLMTPLVTPE